MSKKKKRRNKTTKNSRTTTIEVFGNVVGGSQSISVTVVHSEGVTSTAI